MASLQPQQCCTTGYKHSGDAEGSFITIEGTSVYITGDKSSKNVLYILPDILGNRYPNVLLTADGFARNGYLVFVVDTFEDKPFTPNDVLGEWIKDHMPAEGQVIAEKVLKAIKSEYKPEFVAAVGYCYGANPAFYLSGKQLIDVAAVAHPSFVTEELVHGLKTPVSIAAAESDNIFTDELRQKTLEILREIKATYYVQVFSGTAHGFAARGNPDDPVVEAARKKVFDDQLWFFKQHGRKQC